MKRITALMFVAMMMVSTAWAYDPVQDADVSVTQLRDGDRTTDGLLVGTPLAERRSTTEARNAEWVRGSIDVNVGGNVTLTPQTPQTRVQYRTRFRTSTRTVHVGLTEEQARGVISVDNNRVRDEINAHTTTEVDGLGTLIEGNQRVLTGNQQSILDAVSTAIQNQFGQYYWLWTIAAGVAACIVMLIMVLRRLGNAQATTATAPAPAAPTSPFPTSPSVPPVVTVVRPSTPVTSVPKAPATSAPATSVVDQVARDDAAAAMKVAKEAGRVAIAADEKAVVAGRAGNWALRELFAEQDEDSDQILGELARLGLS